MEEKVTFNPLRKEMVKVQFIPRMGKITDPDHVLYGGMAENAYRTLTVPIIASTGSYKNVLTNDEKAFFENLLGVNLSVHNKVDNYWDNYSVILDKSGANLDLSNPEDYIKYKVLLANSNIICPSLQEYNDKPLATYQYVLVAEGTELTLATDKRKTRTECYKLVGKIEDDFDTLKTVVEMLEKRPISDDTDATFLVNKLDDLIESNYKEVHRILTDPALPTIVLIKKGVSKGAVIKMGDFYYLKSGKNKIPMCAEGKDPILQQAIAYLNNPKNQEAKFGLEAQVKE